jgi:glycosyltransferase involved in cell wall biosynthesis
MNIMFVMEDFCLGGVERVTLNLISSLNAINSNDFNVSIAVQNASGELLTDYSAQCPIYHIGRSCSRKMLIEALDDFRPDVLVFTKGGLSRVINKRIRGAVDRIYAVQHVPLNLPQNGVLKNIIRIIGAAYYYRRVDKVVCVSNGIRENLRKSILIPRERLLVIHNPVIDDFIYELSRQGGCEYKNFYLCVGRLHYQKGYDLLIKIAREITGHIPDFKVVILGDGPERRNLQMAIEAAGLRDVIILHGNSSNPYKYMMASKAVLMTSRWEGLPTVLVEASALKVPIISFDCRYGPSEITDNGYYGHLIPAQKVSAFAKAVVAFEGGDRKPVPNVDKYLFDYSARCYLGLFLC